MTSKIKFSWIKVAIIHEMLIKLWWAEKVVEQLLKAFPDADLFTLIHDKDKVSKSFWNYIIKTPFFTQFIYKVFRNQRFCLPFMSKAIESIDLSKYDLVISSSSWFAHGAITKPDTTFIVYSHSPARYMWDWTNEYKKDIWWDKWIKWFLLNKLFLRLRQWDFIASKRADIVIANSMNTAKRIEKYHRRKAKIIYPPIEVDRFEKNISNHFSNNILKQYKLKKDWYYIIISALTEFKRIDLAINAFNKLTKNNLVIIWEWAYFDELKKIKEWNNIQFVWAQYWDELVSFVQNSSWLIFPWEEDFWMVPIEVMAAWKPIFAYKWWWLLETVLEWKTWDFFTKKNWIDFIEKFLIFDNNNKSWEYKESVCNKQAKKFSDTIFIKKIKNTIYK